jgi:hypothetical protein
MAACDEDQEGRHGALDHARHSFAAQIEFLATTVSTYLSNSRRDCMPRVVKKTKKVIASTRLSQTICASQQRRPERGRPDEFPISFFAPVSYVQSRYPRY